MPAITVVFGLLLTALGVWGYWGDVLDLWTSLGLQAPNSKSLTALIPAVGGILLVVCGLLAFKESRLKHAMHAAAMVGLLGFVAAVGRLIVLLTHGGKVESISGVSTTIMTLLCGVFVALCINSFIQSRRRRRAASG